MPIRDKSRLILSVIKGRAIVFAFILGLLVFGIIIGDFMEAWRNGATL